MMATEVRDMREMAYGCNVSVSLQYDTVCNCLFANTDNFKLYC